ncbi:MAG: class I SAM-dependent methyltransferase [Gemmatimonadota bacterium]
MKRDAFALMADAEQSHWWYRGRRDFIAAALERVAPPPGAHILDAGCGSGGNLEVLARFGKVSGFEYDAEAMHVARERQIGPVEPGALPGPIPFGDQRFDAIGLFDVLEHLEQPVDSLVALRQRLVDGGALVLTVPANPWLWGPHDVQCQHFRRYTAATLRDHLTSAGFVVEYLSYFNSLLLPLAIAQRIKERVAGYDLEAMPGGGMNGLLHRIWRIERRWIPTRVAPFGLSLIAIARRATPADG